MTNNNASPTQHCLRPTTFHAVKSISKAFRRQAELYFEQSDALLTGHGFPFKPSFLTSWDTSSRYQQKALPKAYWLYRFDHWDKFHHEHPSLSVQQVDEYCRMMWHEADREIKADYIVREIELEEKCLSRDWRFGTELFHRELNDLKRDPKYNGLSMEDLKLVALWKMDGDTKKQQFLLRDGRSKMEKLVHDLELEFQSSDDDTDNEDNDDGDGDGDYEAVNLNDDTQDFDQEENNFQSFNDDMDVAMGEIPIPDLNVNDNNPNCSSNSDLTPKQPSTRQTSGVNASKNDEKEKIYIKYNPKPKRKTLPKHRVYTLKRGIKSPSMMWKEITQGLDGGPSINFITETYGEYWYKLGRDKNEFNTEQCRWAIYKTLMKEVDYIVENELAIDKDRTLEQKRDAAVERIEKIFIEDSWSFRAFMKWLKKEQNERENKEKEKEKRNKEKPVYTLKRFISCKNVKPSMMWKEIMYGSDGNPSLKSIVEKYGNKWYEKNRNCREITSERSIFNNYQSVWDEVEYLADSGLTFQAEHTNDDKRNMAVQHLDRRYTNWAKERGKFDLYSFIKMLRKEQCKRKNTNKNVVFTLKDGVSTPSMVWKEITQGVDGGPSLNSIIEKHGEFWYKIGRSSKEASRELSNFIHKHRIILDEVEYLIENELDFKGIVDLDKKKELAVEHLEKQLLEGTWRRDNTKKKSYVNFTGFLAMLKTKQRRRKELKHPVVQHEVEYLLENELDFEGLDDIDQKIEFALEHIEKQFLEGNCTTETKDGNKYFNFPNFFAMLTTKQIRRKLENHLVIQDEVEYLLENELDFKGLDNIDRKKEFALEHVEKQFLEGDWTTETKVEKRNENFKGFVEILQTKQIRRKLENHPVIQDEVDFFLEKVLYFKALQDTDKKKEFVLKHLEKQFLEGNWTTDTKVEKRNENIQGFFEMLKIKQKRRKEGNHLEIQNEVKYLLENDLDFKGLEDTDKKKELAKAKGAKAKKSLTVYTCSRLLPTPKMLWEEFMHGINGGPSIKSIIETYGEEWYKIGRNEKEIIKEREILDRRQIIWDSVEYLVDNEIDFEGSPTKDEKRAIAIDHLQSRYLNWTKGREKGDTHHFSKLLNKEKLEREEKMKKAEIRMKMIEEGRDLNLPIYTLRRGNNKPSMMWEEIARGVDGGPPFKSIVEKYGNDWYKIGRTVETMNAERTRFQWYQVIWDEVEYLAENELVFDGPHTEIEKRDIAAEHLDMNYSIFEEEQGVGYVYFILMLKKAQKNRKKKEKSSYGKKDVEYQGVKTRKRKLEEDNMRRKRSKAI